MSTKQILLIQTEHGERERLTGLLLQDWDSIVHANNGAEGLALFRQGSFDLVITDSEMPFLNGNELAEQIKQRAPSLPILMLSSSWQRPGPDNPVDASLHRRCQPQRLRQVVDELLGKADRRRTSGAGARAESESRSMAVG
jgi:CheY-like chemotaxis protein